VLEMQHSSLRCRLQGLLLAMAVASMHPARCPHLLLTSCAAHWFGCGCPLLVCLLLCLLLQVLALSLAHDQQAASSYVTCAWQWAALLLLLLHVRLLGQLRCCCCCC
jgi:hypothetical protein